MSVSGDQQPGKDAKSMDKPQEKKSEAQKQLIKQLQKDSQPLDSQKQRDPTPTSPQIVP